MDTCTLFHNRFLFPTVYSLNMPIHATPIFPDAPYTYFLSQPTVEAPLPPSLTTIMKGDADNGHNSVVLTPIVMSNPHCLVTDYNTSHSCRYIACISNRPFQRFCSNISSSQYAIRSINRGCRCKYIRH